jgi:hypothetical protein
MKNRFVRHPVQCEIFLFLYFEFYFKHLLFAEETEFPVT